MFHSLGLGEIRSVITDSYCVGAPVIRMTGESRLKSWLGARKNSDKDKNNVFSSSRSRLLIRDGSNSNWIQKEENIEKYGLSHAFMWDGRYFSYILLSLSSYWFFNEKPCGSLFLPLVGGALLFGARDVPLPGLRPPNNRAPPITRAWKRISTPILTRVNIPHLIHINFQW